MSITEKILWIPVVLIAILIAYFIAFVWLVTKPFAKWMKKNDELITDDWEDTDQHPWINGDCCRCMECTDKFHKELAEIYGDTETLTEINHNLRNNR